MFVIITQKFFVSTVRPRRCECVFPYLNTFLKALVASLGLSIAKKKIRISHKIMQITQKKKKHIVTPCFANLLLHTIDIRQPNPLLDMRMMSSVLSLALVRNFRIKYFMKEKLSTSKVNSLPIHSVTAVRVVVLKTFIVYLLPDVTRLFIIHDYLKTL